MSVEPAATAVAAEVLGASDDLAPIADAWRRLAEARGNAFVTPEWYAAWRDSYGAGTSPRVVAVRRGADLIGVVPLQRSRQGAARLLRFGGSNLGDDFHAAALPGDEDEVWRACVGALMASRDWGALLLERVPAGATWVAAMRDAAPRRLGAIHLKRDRMPAIDLGGQTWDEYLAGRSAKLRSQIRRDTRLLEREHGLVIRLSDDPGTLDRDMEAFFHLHLSRWAERGGSRSIMERSRAFHLRFAREAQARGWLRLWILELDSEPAAAWYGWRLGDSYSHYLGGFDPRWSNRGLGIVVLARAIRAAIEEGAAEFDFLLGTEPYKFRFATGERAVETVALARPLSASGVALRAEATARGAYARMPDSIKGRLRAAFGRLAPSSADR